MKAKLLSPKQRTMLTQIAARGWRKMSDAKAIDEPFDDWRTREAVAACGARISQAPASAFDDLFEHFKVLSGAVVQAFDIAMGPENERRQWIFKIRKDLEMASLADEYALSIAQDKFKRGAFAELTLKQLQALFYDTHRAVKAKLAQVTRVEVVS
jgi:ABC-type arginine transport system ATPase subunit